MKQNTTDQSIKELSVSVKNLTITVKNLADTVLNLSETVKNLAVYTVKGFAEINERIDKIEENMATKDGMDKVYNRFAKTPLSKSG